LESDKRRNMFEEVAFKSGILLSGKSRPREKEGKKKG